MHRSLGLVALALALFAGCAEERDAVNRVQPYALKKAWFIGEDFVDTRDDPEFYTQGTLIDVGYGATQDGLFTSTYAQPLSRIKWQITEDMLIGRIAYERIDGSDGKGTGGPVEDGVIAVAYRIESHFDIAHAYNSTTGEQLNIIEENTYDRPWYEREYIRVDWSKNLNVDSYDFDTLSLVGIYGGVQYESMSYSVTDPNDPDAPHFDLENGYFDVTGKAFAKPGLIDLSSLGWGMDSFPSCFLDADFMGGAGPTGSCNPVELTIRQSFRRVEDTDYEPANWDGLRFQAYGAFTSDRMGYDDLYGVTDQQWRRFISRHNIWEKSHAYKSELDDDGNEVLTGYACNTSATTPFGADVHRDDNHDGTEDECAAVGNGSRCDEFKHLCTLPYREREVKPVIWYYSKGSNPEYFAPSADAIHEWDVVLRTAVMTARLTECLRTEKDQEACYAKWPMYTGQQNENEDALALATEVDNCRAGLSHPELKKNFDACNEVADCVAGKRGYSEGVVAIAKMPEMFILCHSPVEAGDHPLCASEDERLPEGIAAEECEDAWLDPDSELAEACAKAKTVRSGDLRYNVINAIVPPQSLSPWGIMTDSNDPLSGEVVAASVNVWTYVNGFWAQKVVDTLRYMYGELTDEQITEGENIRDWSAAAIAASEGSSAPRFTSAALQERLAGFTQADIEEIEGIQLPASIQKRAIAAKKAVQKIKASSKVMGQMRGIYGARAELARGTELEAELMTPAVQQMMGVENMAMSQSVLKHASLLQGGNPSFQRDLHRMKENALAERGACIMQEAPIPYSYAGLARVLQEKFGKFNPNDSIDVQNARADQMRRFVANKAHRSTIVHEIGHSVGLRHNFVSSSDAYNYRPQYWQLRTHNGRVTDVCTELQADGSNCVGPRYFDPVDADEKDNMIWMWMHSSTMDYAGETTQDMLGLGAYDFAAARMFYGDAVSVFADESYKEGEVRGTGMLNKMDNFGGILGFSWDIGEENHHYSELQNVYELIKDCKKVNPENWRPDYWDEERYGEWDPTIDSYIVKVDGEYSRCKSQPVDYVQWRDLHVEASENADAPAIDENGRIRVPYGFATDSWADLGNLSVYRHDNGADPYELFDFWISGQEINHIFDNYRRGRQTFSIRGAVSRTLERYNEKMRDAAKGLGLIKAIYKEMLTAPDADGQNGWTFGPLWTFIAANWLKDNVLASGMAFDHFTRQLARPAHGDHYIDPVDNRILRSSTDSYTDYDVAAVVPNGATGYMNQVSYGGRPVENAYLDTVGEYRTEMIKNAGSYYDKLYTAMLMAESVDNYVSDSRSDFTDGRYRSISMADIFPDAYRRWLANNLTGDDFIKGARVAAKDGLPLVDHDGYLASPIAWTTWWTKTPTSCLPNENSVICGTFGAWNDNSYAPENMTETLVLDPQVDWEQQKFLIAWTMLYLPENQKQTWLDMMNIWELGADSDPGFSNRIEFHHPNGRVYIAKTFGTETLFGETVQKGIAARVLEYANSLLKDAYVTTEVDYNGDGKADWYEPVYSSTGAPLVQFDPNMIQSTESGTAAFISMNCNRNNQTGCTCDGNRACMKLENYSSMPVFMRQTMRTFNMADVSMRGIY